MSVSRRGIIATWLVLMTFGSTAAMIGPVRGAFAATVDLVDCATGNLDIPSKPDGSTFTVCLRIKDADDMDSWGVTLNYYSIVLTAVSANYTSCGGYTLPRFATIVDDVGDGVRGQVDLGETYFVVPAVGFTGSCILAYIDFQVDNGSSANHWSTGIHITSFKASSVKQLGIQTAVVSMPVGLTTDAYYGPHGIRYVDFIDSPISKRCVIENHHYRWSISRDGADGKMSFNCTMQAFGDAYPVVAVCRITITDLTINAQFGLYGSSEALFTSKGQTAPCRVDKGALSDDNSDLLVDLALNHQYLVNAEVLYDCRGDTGTAPLGLCGGIRDRVFTFTIKA